MTEQQPPAMCVSGASKSFGNTQALNNISLQVNPSGVTALLGQNGAGKTTLIRAALGLLRLDEGTISLFGNKASERVARQRVGVMLQDSDLPDLLTGRELIRLFASYYPEPLSIDTTLKLTDIGEFADKRYKHLSGGQKRRVQFALAIVGDPDLVFLDEPTTGLDSEARRALWSVVRSFAGAGKTIVLTTHYLEEADALADHVVIMRMGQIVANAPVEKIRASLGGSVIRCVSSVDTQELGRIDGVTRVLMSGRTSQIYTTNTVQTLRQLLAPPNEITNLSIARPSLEDVFAEELS